MEKMSFASFLKLDLSINTQILEVLEHRIQTTDKWYEVAFLPHREEIHIIYWQVRGTYVDGGKKEERGRREL